MESKLTIGITIYLIVVNIMTFVIMGNDKHKAEKSKFRIPEKTLFTFSLIGGSLGGIVGMRFFRHKTKKWQFRYGFPLILIVQLALIVLVVTQR
jgi:uncharacterized membrane protein YsdA (DUF1294 family)